MYLREINNDVLYVIYYIKHVRNLSTLDCSIRDQSFPYHCISSFQYDHESISNNTGRKRR